jgi:hypothetical protein
LILKKEFSRRNIGAVAELFDISCLTRIPFLFDRITDAAISAWKAAPKSVTPQEVISALGMFNTGIVLGMKLSHYQKKEKAD